MKFPTSTLLDQSISVLRVVGLYFSFLFIFNRTFFKQTVEDQTSDLGLQCLPMSHKKDVRFIWVK